MVKQRRTAIQKIQTLETMKIAKLFFYTYLTPSIATKIMHPKAWEKCREKHQQGFVMPYIRDCFKEWEKQGFIETSPVKLPFRVDKKKGKPYFLKNYGYRLSLEPLYRYCEEEKKIKFTEKEKEIVNNRIGLETMRKRILREYPDDNIINAILKFYIKHYGIFPGEMLDKKERELLERAEKMSEENLRRAERHLKMVKDKLKKHKWTKQDKEPVNVERLITEQTEKEVYERYKENKMSLNDVKEFAKHTALLLYVTSYKKSPELISSINAKFKKALGILLDY